MSKETVTRLEAQLKSFDLATRTRALEELVALADGGLVPLDPEADAVNMHCHSFFSFNACGHSPSSLAWLARRRGLRGVGIVDFDVLDGVDEFLDACDVVGVRGSAGIETRVYVPQYGTKAINSPDEPGVCYHMGVGFATGQVPPTVAPVLCDLGRRTDARNREILARVNAHLEPVMLDYERDVLSLTPAGHPTERHMVAAFIRAAERQLSEPAAFWAGKLGIARGEMASPQVDEPRFHDLVRTRLMKRGGVGYVQPESGMFPSLRTFHDLIVACGALPCAAWLDGTTETERAIEDWLGYLVNEGVVALNIIPDRNWNISDPEIRRLKVQNLHHVVALAEALDLAVNVGTEMNSFDQKVVDDFDAPELAPVRQAFLDGAHFFYGHTIMQRVLGLGYQSAWAERYLPSRRERKRFYTRIGYRLPPGAVGVSKLRCLDVAVPPTGMQAQLGLAE